MDYKPTIGLEIHAELKTATKMFCGCLNDADEKRPNVNVCPVCLGHPGVLPTINKKAVKSIIKIGLAIKGEINEVFRFDRKNYFYPDLPKGYQISQFEQPIVKGGEVDVSARARKPEIIKITRIHLEEDAGKLIHSNDGNSTLVDFNRGGMPLMELVTEPVIHDAKTASFFAKELQLILRYLEVSDADMEKGQMRVDANISLGEIADLRGISADYTEERRKSQHESASSLRKSVLGTKVEIKNLNSFRAVEQALNYEIERQQKVLKEGGKIEQETRGWNDVKQKTESQRSKEESHDYRYFPEPDLPSLAAGDFDLEALRLEITELPNEKRERLEKQYELNASQVDFLIEDKESAEFFEKAVSELEADEQKLVSKEKIKLIINYLATDLIGLMKEKEIGFKELLISPENFADLIEMIDKKEVSSRIAKDLLYKMAKTGGDSRQMVKEEGLHQVSGEEELILIVKKIIEENSAAVADYKKGKTTALQFLVGKAMAALRGKGNPQILQKLFKDNL